MAPILELVEATEIARSVRRAFSAANAGPAMREAMRRIATAAAYAASGHVAELTIQPMPDIEALPHLDAPPDLFRADMGRGTVRKGAA